MTPAISSSVVICTRNRPDGLQTCLRSLAEQTMPPTELIIVDAGSDGRLADRLATEFGQAPFSLRYLHTTPSLVLQRNIGIEQCTGEVVFFFDDDVVLEADYLERVLAVYQQDVNADLGGVQGSITNAPRTQWGAGWLRRLFLLTRSGRRGYLQRSGFPCFSFVVSQRTDVELFSGCMMSYRRRLLDKHRFDEALQRYWPGDDWDLSYRISREARLVQLPNARLAHNQTDVSRDSLGLVWRMTVVNHHYLYSKHCRPAGQTWLPWLWAEVGLLLLALLRMFAGRGSDALKGMLRGFRELRGRARSATVAPLD
jgi:glycosyltransferase involved in cell wall biosynthesis